MWTQSLWRHETATGKPAASSFLGYIASDGCHPNSTSQALWWQRCLMGAWRDAIFEMLMQPATAPGLLDLSQCCVANDTSCFYGGMFTNESIAKPREGLLESASPHTFVSVRPGSLAPAMLTAQP